MLWYKIFLSLFQVLFIGDSMDKRRPKISPNATCEEVRECLSRYVVDPSYYSDGERGIILQHLAGCAECREAYAEITRTLGPGNDAQ